MAKNENENDAAQVYLLGKTHLANDQGQFYIRNDPIVHMASGDRHTIIITQTGRAFAFGDNSSGRKMKYILNKHKINTFSQVNWVLVIQIVWKKFHV
jgi:alpha-tubulin suppressor-like RCC1 family protein